jgi:hypothetical protein
MCVCGRVHMGSSTHHPCGPKSAAPPAPLLARPDAPPSPLPRTRSFEFNGFPNPRYKAGRFELAIDGGIRAYRDPRPQLIMVSSGGPHTARGACTTRQPAPLAHVTLHRQALPGPHLHSGLPKQQRISRLPRVQPCSGPTHATHPSLTLLGGPLPAPTPTHTRTLPACLPPPQRAWSATRASAMTTRLASATSPSCSSTRAAC